MAVQFLDRTRRLPTSPEQIEARFTHDEWLMTDAERSALADLLRQLRPRCAVEIGTYQAGSLAVMAEHCEHVYTLDIDTECEARYGHQFRNVEFVTGPSAQTLPPLLDDIRQRGEELSFVLIDANHSEAGVRGDIERVLAYRPSTPMYIVMHDSFNPGCRRGILTADWASNPHVHLVEADYVVGRFIGKEEADGYRTMWCGFALAVLLPEPRQGDVRIHQNEELMFRSAFWRSVYPVQRLLRPLRRLRFFMHTIRSRLRAVVIERFPALYRMVRGR